MSEQKETAEIVKSIPLFGDLSKRDCTVLAKAARLRRLEAFSKIVEQGEPGESCFVLLDGGAEVVRNSERVAELSPGSVFGELSLIDGGERSASVTMLTRGEVLEVQRAGFDRLMETSPAASRSVLEQLCTRLRDLDTTVYG